jgi:hypothetical protein
VYSREACKRAWGLLKAAFASGERWMRRKRG